MHCTPLPGGGFVCGSRARRPRCSVPGCARDVEKECDYPVVRKGKAGTCDAKLCGAHAKPAGPGKDLCPAHDARARADAAAAPPDDGLKERG